MPPSLGRRPCSPLLDGIVAPRMTRPNTPTSVNFSPSVIVCLSTLRGRFGETARSFGGCYPGLDDWERPGVGERLPGEDDRARLERLAAIFEHTNDDMIGAADNSGL